MQKTFLNKKKRFNVFYKFFQPSSVFYLLKTLTSSSSCNYMEQKETSLFDAWTEQWLRKHLPVHSIGLMSFFSLHLVIVTCLIIIIIIRLFRVN